MPRQTAFKAMSPDQQREYLARRGLLGPKPKADRPAAVVKVAKRETDPAARDGLLWLASPKRKKARLSAEQAREGLHYRDLFRLAEPGAAIQSSIENLGMGGGGGKGSPTSLGGSFEDAAQKLELFVIRHHLLGNQDDLVTVMNGVCGQGWTLRYLAGGNQVRAAELEQALRIALDLMVGNRRLKTQAIAARKKAA